MLSIGLSLSQTTLRNAQVSERSDEYGIWSKAASIRIMVCLFMFGFEGDEPSVFEDTLRFNIEAKFDMCGYSLLTPYPAHQLVRDDATQADCLLRLG